MVSFITFAILSIIALKTVAFFDMLKIIPFFQFRDFQDIWISESKKSAQTEGYSSTLTSNQALFKKKTRSSTVPIYIISLPSVNYIRVTINGHNDWWNDDPL